MVMYVRSECDIFIFMKSGLQDYLKHARYYRDELDLFIAPVEAPIVDAAGKVEPTKNGKKKYYKVMPVGYEGRYNGKNDYLREVTDAEVTAWYSAGYGLAVVTKGWSERLKKYQRVFDVDSFGGLTKETFWAKYGGALCENLVTETARGYHIFVFSDTELTINNFTVETDKGDILTGENRHGPNSGHTVEAPSLAVDEEKWILAGNYKIASPSLEPGELPVGWKVTNHSVNAKENVVMQAEGSIDTMRAMIEGKTAKGTGQGVYDMNLRQIGLIISKIPNKDDVIAVKAGLKKAVVFNQEHKLGYTEEEIGDTFFSVLKKDTVSEKRLKIDKDIDTVRKAGGRILQDTTDGGVYIQVDGKRNNLLAGKTAKRWVTNIIEPKTTGDLNNVLMRLDAAIDEKASLQYRVARNVDNAIVYDIGDDLGTIVTVRNGIGWDYAVSPDVRLFKTSPGNKEQVLPVKGGALSDIFEFVNIRGDMRELFLCLLVYYFIPEVQYPILSLYGGKGSGKSTTAQFIRGVVDPNSIPFDTLDNKRPENTQLALSTSYMSVIDNVSSINQELSDMLCLFATGGGARKRALFTDGDVHLTKTLKPVVMTGVNQEMKREDLLSRSILMEVEPLESTLSLTELQARFNEKLPGILGGVFNALVGLDISDVSNKGLVRMSEFHKYVRAIAVGLEFDVSSVDSALIANFENQEYESLANSDVAEAVLDFMKDKKSFSGTATELHKALSEESIAMAKKNPIWISRDLQRLTGSLKMEGFYVKTTRTSQKKIISIVNKNEIEWI